MKVPDSVKLILQIDSVDSVKFFSQIYFLPFGSRKSAGYDISHSDFS